MVTEHDDLAKLEGTAEVFVRAVVALLARRLTGMPRAILGTVCDAGGSYPGAARILEPMLSILRRAPEAADHADLLRGALGVLIHYSDGVAVREYLVSEGQPSYRELAARSFNLAIDRASRLLAELGR